MIAGIGIDILSLTRFRTLLLKRDPYKVAKRICTEAEFELFGRLSMTGNATSTSTSTSTPTNSSFEENAEGSQVLERQLRFLSCRWALKEAAYKSLSAHLHGISWKDLHITHTKSGAPVLYPTQKDHRDRFDLIGSLSHDAGMVVGMVIAQFKK
ncbi:uncharacterized protein I303_107051 [Kwoniella dejecticola CBS 10117]|uniref:4'-phosphopantetheinyl transferase domain-containing protein n=1 Tax=Kwoniella dejecticola CBS 10117 TaxID=1296121 RepID=A0A1A5ZYK9_9TREE|nr:uncharacterized protein I303_06452 [Kwoniella dejecticola CBS 10117]OBR82895.1 hypothetical protein I303_06452 [Kwoniella dejecticola CBS 10117]